MWPIPIYSLSIEAYSLRLHLRDVQQQPGFVVALETSRAVPRATERTQVVARARIGHVYDHQADASKGPQCSHQHRNGWLIVSYHSARVWHLLNS